MAMHNPVVPMPQTTITTTRQPERYAAAIAAGAQMPYNNGPLIANVEAYMFYWGSAWTADPAQSAIAGQINAFVASFVSGSDLDRLAEYSTADYQIGRGQLVAAPVTISSDPPSSVSDAALQQSLRTWIDDRGIGLTENTLFLILTPPGIEIVADWGGRSCGTTTNDFSGYHSDIAGDLFYAIVPQCVPAQQTSGLAAIDYFRMVISHEICEAITDPVFRTGWYSPQLDEIGDPCAWQARTGADGGVIQKLWSNNAGGCA